MVAELFTVLIPSLECLMPSLIVQVDDRLHEIVGALVGGTDQKEETMASIDSEVPEGYDRPPTTLSSGVGPSEPLLRCEEKVCVEALRGLAALLPHLPAETVLPHTPLLLIRARLFAEKVSFWSLWQHRVLQSGQRNECITLVLTKLEDTNKNFLFESTFHYKIAFSKLTSQYFNLAI